MRISDWSSDVCSSDLKIQIIFNLKTFLIVAAGLLVALCFVPPQRQTIEAGVDPARDPALGFAPIQGSRRLRRTDIHPPLGVFRLARRDRQLVPRKPLDFTLFGL